MLDDGHDYPAIGLALGIPPGQAYLIATGGAADGSRPGATQNLVNPPHANPASTKIVHDWIAARVAADPQQRGTRAKESA